MLDLNLANAGGAVIGFEVACADPRVQHSRSRPARQHRALALPLAADQLPAADDRRPAVQPRPTPIRGRRTRARRILAARPAAASRTCPNVGLRRRRGISANLDANYALSDFDRPHRFSTSFIYELPGFARGFRVSGFVQVQSGLPYSHLRGGAGDADRGAVHEPRPRLRRPLSRGVRTAEPVRLARRAASALQAIRPKRRSTRPCSARRAASPAAIPQPGLRQPRPQRAARVLAAPRRPEPRARLQVRRRTASSSCGGTSSTCSTRSTTRCPRT